jgi:hypothetical protein
VEETTMVGTGAVTLATDEPEAGVVMNRAEYSALWQRLTERSLGVLREQAKKLDVILEVMFVPSTAGAPHRATFSIPGGPRVLLATVTGPDVSTLYAKAIALAVDGRLAAMREARRPLDALDEALECERTGLQLSRLICLALFPQPIALTHAEALTPNDGRTRP